MDAFNYYDPNRMGYAEPKYHPELRGMLDANDDPGAVIRAMMADAKAKAVPQEPPSFLQRVGGPPAAAAYRFLTTRDKLPGRAQADAERQHFVEGMLDVYGRPEDGREPSAWARLPEDVVSDMRNYASNKDGFRNNITNPSEQTGFLGPGSPLNTASTWMMSMPNMAYQGSHLLANAVANEVETAGNAGKRQPRPAGGGVKTNAQAANDLVDATGTFMAPMTSLLGIDTPPTAWSRAADARKAMDENPETDPFRPDARAKQQYAADVESMAGRQGDGEGLLTDYGVDKLIGRIPTRIMGMTMDSILNPWYDGKSIIQAARAGKMGQATMGLALEHGPDALAAGAVTYAEQLEADRQKQLLKRLEEARR